MACILGAEKPKIDYPLFWEYKVVLDATTQKREQIDEILKGENLTKLFGIDFINLNVEDKRRLLVRWRV